MSTETEASRGPVLNIDEAEEHDSASGEHWGGTYKILTPYMEQKGGGLCANLSRMAPGRAGCPYHFHMLDDELFFVLSGTGVLRYGEQSIPIRAGDMISCPAGTGTGHQIASTGEEDLVYLGIGRNSPNEVCVFPDSDKVHIRGLKLKGRLTKTDFMDGEPEPPLILAAAKEQGGG
jgi:uncharacterized cupin superfamily protein